MIELTDTPVIINGPEDPELLKLWDLAIAKFTTREGRAPATRVDMRRIVQDYHALLAKPHGSVAQIIAQVMTEKCSEVPNRD